ncbi:hypothetical protein DYB25_010361 [Aphanomyces astaci]|uniref:Uncharacterized protein n=2 Tax=Aphanomyces astaci TaxID=112090 RepID=A0A397C719_APHAT|nr:hypothetical protein DYB25_010361 [Aphanomyces astaci]
MCTILTTVYPTFRAFKEHPDMESKPAADATDFVLNFVGGPIKFRADEGALFAKLFHIVPSAIDAAVLSLQEKQFKVAVSSPIVVGSSYTRFTQYVVSTTVR